MNKIRSNSLLALRIAAVCIMFFSLGYRLIYSPVTGDSFKEFLNTLGYFTIQSNLIVFYVFLSLLINQLRGKPERTVSTGLRGAALLYIIITSLVFLTVLNKYIDAAGVNKIVIYIHHSLTALLLLGDYLLSVEKGSFAWNMIPRWLIYPLAYWVFTIVETLTTGRFRYYFLNFPKLGLAKYSLFIFVIILTFCTIGGLIVLINQRHRKERLDQ